MSDRRVDFRILAKWYCFFQRPSLYLHPMRLHEYISVALLNRMATLHASLHRVHEHVSRLILLEHLELTLPYVILPNPLWQLLTCSTHQLQDLVTVLGALEVGPWIRRCIVGEVVREIVSILGEEVVQFVRTRHAGFYQGSGRWQTLSLADLDKTVQHCGYALLAKAGGAFPSGLDVVWALRLPKQIFYDLAKGMSTSDALSLVLAVQREYSGLFVKRAE